MGLDMYAFMDFWDNSATHPDEYVSDVTPTQELHYWRKHPDLHGWMEKLYEEQGGREIFNCIKLNLTLKDLERLEDDMTKGALEETDGFFFGESNNDHNIDTLEFISKARTALNGGSYVWYDSWW